MADQPRPEIPAPGAAPVPAPPSRRQAARRHGFAGLSLLQLMGGIMLLSAIIWVMWVTRALLMPRPDPIVSARLSAIIGDYVQAQTRSAAPPAQVEAEMRQFMARLDGELQRRSGRGQIVLVGEAVLSKNIPDITESLRGAVYAAGVPRPREASAAELAVMQQEGLARSAMMEGEEGGAAPRMAGQIGMSRTGLQAVQAPMPTPVASPRMPQIQALPPAAGVSTFGGPNGDGGQ
ncbi:TrbI F-type domain-containing protein [Sphingobium yanoikuyae]|uniref:Type-F conjugative transfer system protein (TrbI_Ftype) n=1 Tax=Sphingobium yanoikuyae TaxID=13690 RepID=A0A291N062_SPHYA|nr:TrbI F-type domain-containing protein [Sphingobium yanoikuyae]ATI80548.1 hypothetical protein A6768_11460 [Sphingobium yanoikuyae]